MKYLVAEEWPMVVRRKPRAMTGFIVVAYPIIKTQLYHQGSKRTQKACDKIIGNYDRCCT